MRSDLNGYWSPFVREAVEKANRVREARRVSMTEEEAEERAARREFAEEDALADDMDRRDFEADGRL